MAKYYGKVGYGIQKPTAPGVFQEEIIERSYYGDILTNVRRWENGEGLNDNLQVQNQISIIADAFAFQNFHTMRYIIYQGAKWKVRSVQVERPRLVLSIGDVYNDQPTPSSQHSCGCSGSCS